MNHIQRRRDFSPDMAEPARQELPSQLEAEQALLGAVLVNDQYLDSIPIALEERHFEEPLHGAIYREMKRLRGVGKGISPISIKMAVTDAPAQIGGYTFAQYLSRLASEAVGFKNLANYAAAILDAAQRRELIGLAQKLQAIAFEHELTIPDEMKAIEDRLAEVRTERIGGGSDGPSFADAIDESLDKTDDAAHGREPAGIDPGIPEIHALTGPWQKGQLIIIGGGVKQGKSALAMQTMFTIAEKHAVGCNSGEMSRQQLIMREKARRSGIPARSQQQGKVSPQDFDELVRVGAEMKRLKHISIDCRRMTLQQIEAQIARLIGEQGIEAYFLDHIGKIQWTGKMEYEDEFKQGQRATSMLKDMAMKHSIPIIALTHLKKAAFQDYQGRTFKERLGAAMNRRPTYRDLVGNMDKDADQVLIVFQARPIIAGMEPEEWTDDHNRWEEAIEKVTGKADIILSLSRESEFPRRKEIIWNGNTTSYGPPFKQAFNERERLI
jgi:replicative DNA helicase